MKRTKRVLALLLALLLCAALAACGGGTQDQTPAQPDSGAQTPAQPDGPADPAPPAGGPDADGYINCRINGEPTTMDIAKFSQVYDRTVMYNILEPLTRIQDGVVVGAGAESWTVSDDGTVYTFKLRDNSWSDGQKVTARDYLYALQRQADPANAWPLASDLYAVAGFEDIFNGAADMSALGAEAPDDATLVITLRSPNSAFLTNVDLFPCRQDYAEQHGDTYGTEADKIIGCGPFCLTEWVHGGSLTLEKSETYWDADSVQLAKFTFHVIADTNAIMSSFESGALDYVNVSNSEYIQRFSGDSNLVSEPVSAARTMMVVFNCQDPVFSNAKVRLAFSLALDRATLAEVITGGTAVPAAGLIPPESNVGTLNFREAAGDLIGSLAQANGDLTALLEEGMEEAGLGSDPAGLTVKFAWGATTADARTYAELIQQMWQETLGVKVELEFNDSATHMSNINNGNYQAATTSWGANPEPWFQLSRWANAKGGQSNWVSEEYVQMVQGGVAELDDAKRLELYRQAEELLVSEAAAAPLYWTGSIRFSYGYVQNFSENVFDTVGMKRIYTSGR